MGLQSLPTPSHTPISPSPSEPWQEPLIQVSFCAERQERGQCSAQGRLCLAMRSNTGLPGNSCCGGGQCMPPGEGLMIPAAGSVVSPASQGSCLRPPTCTPLSHPSCSQGSQEGRQYKDPLLPTQCRAQEGERKRRVQMIGAAGSPLGLSTNLSPALPKIEWALGFCLIPVPTPELGGAHRREGP